MAEGAQLASDAADYGIASTPEISRWYKEDNCSCLYPPMCVSSLHTVGYDHGQNQIPAAGKIPSSTKKQASPNQKNEG